MERHWLDWQKYYERGWVVPLGILAWAAYFFVVPLVWSQHWLAGMLFMLFPGVFVSNLLIYFQHECWHNYFDTGWNRRLFVALCTILFVQVHLYDIGHRTHHAKVNTYEDLELYPIGKIENRALRILCNCLSIVFGSVFLVALGGGQKSGLTRGQAIVRFFLTYTGTALIWGSIAYASWRLLGVSVADIAATYLLSIWLVSFFHHHNELIEHGNLIVEGDFRFRSLQTRNLASQGLLARCCLFLAHQDSREHTLHHTDPSTYHRPFIGRHAMPEGSVYISLLDYAAVLKSMVLGRTEVIRQGAAG